MSYLKPYTILLLIVVSIVSCKAKQVSTKSPASKVVYFTSKVAAKNYYKSKADVNYAEPQYGLTALIIASYEGNYELVKYLISKGADVNKASTEEEVTPLNRAASKGHLNIVKLLLKHKADINHQDKLGSTPLMRAAYSGAVDVVQELISQKALIDVRANRGESAIFLAVDQEQVDVVKLLLAHGANIERPNVFEETPLSKAKALKNTRLIELLNHKNQK